MKTQADALWALEEMAWLEAKMNALKRALITYAQAQTEENLSEVRRMLYGFTTRVLTDFVSASRVVVGELDR